MCRFPGHDSLLHKTGEAGVGEFSHRVTPLVFDSIGAADGGMQVCPYRPGNPFPEGYTSSFVSLWKHRRGDNVVKVMLWKTN